MGVVLSKGGNVNLSKEDASLKKVLIGLGWEARQTDGQSFDLDASCFLVDETEKCLDEKDFIFYNNTTSADGSIFHHGDNKTGAGDGDDEIVEVNLDGVPARIKKIVFCVSIHEAERRGQNFGMVSNAFIRVVNKDSEAEITRFDLSEDASTNTTMIFGELYRHNDNWKFKAVGQGYDGGLEKLILRFGLSE